MLRTILTISLVSAVCAAQPAPVPLQARPFPLGDVRLLDGPFRSAMQRDIEYILSLDPDRLLHTFRLNAGLPSTAEPLGGWEKPDIELRGHTLGHYLSACSLLYASTHDVRFKQRIDRVVAALAEVQDALAKNGSNPGYLSAFPESFMDRWDAPARVWAPWYTLHKVMAGLLDSYELAGNRQALEVLKKMAAWTKFRVDRRSPEQLERSMNNEIGGIMEVLANLYGITKDPDHLAAARAFHHKAILDPLARGEDPLDGKHANTQIPKLIGAARLYELTGDPQYKRMSEFFWQRVALARSFVHGGHSDDEKFFPVDQFATHLGPETAETCNTYNMLKLTRHLFSWHPSEQLMGFYERALFNHILASQDPVKGGFVYYTTVKPGHFKTYSTPTKSFWCCVGTGMENHARYTDAIYFEDKDSLWVNLFLASELDWKEKGVTLRQETHFPDDDTIRFSVKVKSPVRFVLNLRHPVWANGMAIRLNHKSVDAGTAGSYAKLERNWKTGDVIDVKLPMQVHTEILPGVPDQIAFLYGPIVLAGELGNQGIAEDYAEDQRHFSKLPAASVPELSGTSLTAVKDKPLTFTAAGGVELIPMYRMHHQHYTLYWKIHER